MMICKGALVIFVCLLQLHFISSQRYIFHEQGQDGPHSYKFGYDTGHGYNRQMRFEERDGYGNVKGYYTYYDPKGNERTVKYTSSHKGGYKASGDFGKFPKNGH